MKQILHAIPFLALMSCADYEGEDVLPTDRMDGPGLFTGESGGYRIPLNTGSYSDADDGSRSTGRQKLKKKK